MESKKFWHVFFLFFCFWLPFGGWANAEEMIQIPKSTWNELKIELNAQNADLTMLREKQKLLEMNSTEQVKLVEDLQTQLRKTKNLLETSTTSLQEVKNALTESRASLTKLREAIKQEEHKKEILKRQRNTWVLAALSLGVGIAWR